jgi:hypothetical protein
MQRTIAMLTMAAALALAATGAAVPAGAGFLFKGNDTGGIIAWSPEVARTYPQIAAAHCARYGRWAHITSVHAWYGDYIGFACTWSPYKKPVGSRTVNIDPDR